MAVHLPLSEEAQKEAREIILSTNNLLKPATGLPIVSPDKDIVLGCYWLTKIKQENEGVRIFGDENETILAYESKFIGLPEMVKVRIKGKILETSAGRIIFNNI